MNCAYRIPFHEDKEVRASNGYCVIFNGDIFKIFAVNLYSYVNRLRERGGGGRQRRGVSHE